MKKKKKPRQEKKQPCYTEIQFNLKREHVQKNPLSAETIKKYSYRCNRKWRPTG